MNHSAPGQLSDPVPDKSDVLPCFQEKEFTKEFRLIYN